MLVRVHAVGRHRAAGARGASRSRGRHAVVIGRSDIVGKPMAMLLLHRDATVTICHSRTPDLPASDAQADILVAAVGRPGFVHARASSSRAPRSSMSGSTASPTRRWRALFPEGIAAARGLSRTGIGARRRRAPGRRRGGRRADAGARRRRPLTIAMLHAEHGERRARGRRAGWSACRADRRHRDRQEHVLARVRGARRATIDADVLAREAVAPGTPAWRRVVERFGHAVLDATARSTGARWPRWCSPIAAARARSRAHRPSRVYARIDAWFDALAARARRWPSPTFRCSSRPARARLRWGRRRGLRPDEQLRRVMARDGLSRSRSAPAPGRAVADRRESPSRRPRHPTDGSFDDTERSGRRVSTALSSGEALTRTCLNGVDAVRGHDSAAQRPWRPWRARCAPRRTCSIRGTAGTARAARCCGSGSARRRADRGRRPRRA